MNKTIVIGGGLAGLSASVNLAEKNHSVILLEASPKLGGRAYSFYDSGFGCKLDNGQHLLMGCYYETLNFLKKIGAYNKLSIPENLEAVFVNRNGEQFRLSAKGKYYPFNLVKGLLDYKAIHYKSRLKIIDFFMDLFCCVEEDLDKYSVAHWLKMKHQDEEAVKAFWEILVVGAMNTTIEKASARIFAIILKQMFFGGKDSASLILPGTTLSELYVNDSVEYFKQRNGEVKLSEKVVRINYSGGKVTGIETDKNHYTEFDNIITAVPLHALSKFFPDEFSEKIIPDNGLNYSPILNVYFLLKENPFGDGFWGLIGSPAHWLFSHGNYINVVSSAAENLIGLDYKQIIRHFCTELQNYFPFFDCNQVIDTRVIKEKRATFIPDNDSVRLRREITSPFENLFFAGDWTVADLPSTIESAVLSGRRAADMIFEKESGQ